MIILVDERRAERSGNNKIYYKEQALEKVTTYEYLGMMITKHRKVDVE